ncbi:low temperature requirement protein A [Micromonospora sp. WMMD1076]|uniref:low temperature requirement protein A n=1 Tax=Micromonospora TaxID=1873 RepID=UPI00249B748F|nr:low temperature requirement protein A [Micromonospora sp. WMMD1076]WFF04642.1 low temperature requirement protein A [Micromonospora sp. WMMD1076]
MRPRYSTDPAPLDPARQPRATFLELFFDLVFVFALTRIVSRVYDHLVLDPHGSTWARALPQAFTTLLLLLALFGLWQGTSWTTSRYHPDSLALQAVVGVALGAGLVMGVTIPRAFDGYAGAFAIAYAAGQFARPLILMFAIHDRHRRMLKVRMLITYGMTGALWITGALVGGRILVPAWTLALVMEYAAARTGWPLPFLGRSEPQRWDIMAEHLAERYQQFFLIALGETILVIGFTYSTGPFDRDHTLAFVTAAATSALLWRLYYHRAGHILAEAIGRSREPSVAGRSAADTHLIMIVGVVTTALGYEITIEQPFGHAPPTWIAPVLLGPAIFIAGRARLEHHVFARVSPARYLTLAALLLSYPAATHTSPFAAAVVAAVILLAAAVADARRAYRHGAEPARPPR